MPDRLRLPPAAELAHHGLEDDVLAMLDVGESDALPQWLGQRLGSYVPGVRMRVLRIFPAQAARIKGLGRYEAFSLTEGPDDKPVPVGMDAPLVAAVRNRFPLSIDSSETGRRLLALFEAGGEVRFVLELRSRSASHEADGRVEALVNIARKYYGRLVDGETDPLTRLSSRRRLQAHVDAGRAWAAPGRAYYFAMLDIDHFKRVNDTFGHLYGDEILVHFANLMRSTFRAGDQLFRFGGEEFVLIFGVDSPQHGGEGTLQRFRAAVEAFDFPGVGRKITVSIGYTRISDARTPAATLIDRADQAVYYAKGHGRNRVCSWDELVASGELKPPAAAAPDVTLF